MLNIGFTSSELPNAGFTSKELLKGLDIVWPAPRVPKTPFDWGASVDFSMPGPEVIRAFPEGFVVVFLASSAPIDLGP